MPYMNESARPLGIQDLGFERYAKNQAIDQVAHPLERVARVIEAHRTRWVLSADGGQYDASVRGTMHYDLDADAFPKVGDWVFFAPLSNMKATIEEVLPRFSAVTRKDISGNGSQVIVTNVDTVLVVQAVDQELSVPKLERYLALARESKAKPVIVLTKADMGANLEAYAQMARAAAPSVPQVSVSSSTGAGMEELLSYLKPRETVVLLGSSGAGKSTLLNALMKSDIQETQAVREDDGKGKHTTTVRSLFALPSGALLIDTPGMRELTLSDDEEAKRDTFDDVTEISYGCRFPNCDHSKSKGCAVLEALSAGSLEEKRYRGYLKFLIREKKAEVKKVGNQHSDRVKSNRAMLDYESRRQSEDEARRKSMMEPRMRMAA